MEDKKFLKIDLGELCSALEDSSNEHDYYLNLETGEILFISEYIDDKETEKLKDQIEENFDCYELIPKTESREGYRDMEDFIATVDNKHLSELLEVAINGRGAFRRLKEVLLNYSEERERWFKSKDKRMQERALECLKEIGVTLS